MSSVCDGTFLLMHGAKKVDLIQQGIIKIHHKLSVCKRAADTGLKTDVSPDGLSSQPMSQAMNPMSAQK